jgi:hypothetical protein
MSDQGASFDMSAVAVPAFGLTPSDHTSLLLPLSIGDLGTARYVSLTPSDGSQLNVDPELARFTPIVAVVDVRQGDSPIAYAVIGSLWWLVFDGTNLPSSSSPSSSTGFSPFMREHSTIAKLDSNRYSISVIPNGGWWRSNIRLEFISGQILPPP